MRPVLLIDVVGLTPRQLGARTPCLSDLARRGACAPMTAVLPAVTCSAQATLLTGLLPREHGVVGNGWYSRDTGEIAFWRQSNALVRGEKLYERSRRLDAGATSAKLFWWFNLGARVDWSVTPRPFYGADGLKVLAVSSAPPELQRELEEPLGPFPFLSFWGPRSGLPASRWIADAAARVLARHRPALTLVYLPHLDYDHQRFGPDAPRSLDALGEVDALVGELARAAEGAGAEVAVVSEYGIEAVSRPVHPNRRLREAGLLRVRPGPLGEGLDPFASAAFCVSDHQVAHLYARDGRALAAAREALSGLPGIEQVLDGEGKRAHGLDHANAGDAVLVAEPDAWFTYYFWLDDGAAPDYARTVDIHRKPGYDPCELFVDPGLAFPALRVARRLAQKKLGFRYLMDVIPLDASLVRGSHGRLPAAPERGPVFIASRPFSECGGEPADGVVDARSVPDRVLALLQRRGG